MGAVAVIECQGGAETISELLENLQKKTAGAQALFAENERIEEMLRARNKGDRELAARYKRNSDLAWGMVDAGADLETRISLSPGRSLEDIKGKLEAARIAYAYEQFSDPISALLYESAFEPSVVSMASILIDALRLLGIDAGDIVEMKARHEAHLRDKA